MKRKSLLMIVVIIIFVLSSKAQVIKTELVTAPQSVITEFKSSAYIVKASISNLIAMYNMTTKEWETEMNKLTDYKGPTISPQYIEYVTTINMSIHDVMKNPILIAINYVHSGMPSVMEDLFNELEPYYTGFENGSQIFIITKDGTKYKFFLSRSENGEVVVVGKPK